MGEIKNKTIFVTGGAEGIGFQIAKHFLEAEAKLVIIADINHDLGNTSVDKLNIEFGKNKAKFIKCDVTKDAQDILEKVNKDFDVDVLVNSAGIGAEDDPKLTIDINLTATVLLSFKFLELKRKDYGGNGGTIINISSIFGYRITSICPVYHATKFAIIGFTRSLGHEMTYTRSGVRVIAICPGFTSTNLVNKKTVLRAIGEAHEWQTPEAVAKETLKVFKHGDSGMVWTIEGGKLTNLGFSNILPF